MTPIDEVVFEELRKIADFSTLSLNMDLMQDAELRAPLEKYLLLTHYANGLKFDPIQIFYNRYYWFTMLTETYLRKFGDDDLNLRQEGFKILEEGDRFDNIDWNEVEEISKLAK